MADRPEAERTEEATPRSRDEAHEEGRIPRSQELTIAVSLLASAVVFSTVAPLAGRGLFQIMGTSLASVGATTLDAGSARAACARPRSAHSSATLGLIVALTAALVRDGGAPGARRDVAQADHAAVVAHQSRREHQESPWAHGRSSSCSSRSASSRSSASRCTCRSRRRCPTRSRCRRRRRCRFAAHREEVRGPHARHGGRRVPRARGAATTSGSGGSSSSRSA